jgi:hypothetical protein
MLYEVSVDDLIVFADSFASNFRPGTLEDSITFSDAVFSNFSYSIVYEVLLLNDYALVNWIRAFEVEDELVFEDTTVPRSYSVTADDFLILADVLDEPLHGAVSDSFVLSDVAVMTKGYLAGPDTLDLTDAFTSLIVKVVGPSDSLTLSDRFSSVLINELAPDQPSGYTPSGELYKIHFVDSVEDLELCNPDFNDTDTVRYKRINRTTRGYTAIITGIAGWPPFKTKKYTLSYIQISEVNRLRTFCRRNVGRPFTLTDMYGTTYTVIVQNPEFEAAQVGRENFSLTLDFYVL